MARLSNNTEALAPLLSEDFVETDQNGNSRNKAELMGWFAPSEYMH
jgi:hypothetical protein